MSKYPKEGWKIVYEAKTVYVPPKLPEISNVIALINAFDSEVRASYFKQREWDAFYLPFLGFLIAFAEIVHHKIEETIYLAENPRVIPKGPEQLSREPIKKVLIHRGTQGRRRESKNQEMELLYQTKDWYVEFVQKLDGLVWPYFFDSQMAKADLTVEKIVVEGEEYLRVSGHADASQSAEDRWIQQNLNGFYNQPSQWFTDMFVHIAQWLEIALRPEYRHSGFVYIDKPELPPDVPKMYRRSKIPGPTWVSGFGNRLIVPNLHDLTSAQKAEMWDYLLVKQNIYDNEKIDHTVRAEAFSLIADKIPKRAKKHLDLCAGRGDFAQFLGKEKQREPTCLLDIAPQALHQAKDQGFEVVVGNADLSLPFAKNEFNVITVTFAVQWLHKQAFSEILRVLKPNGQVIFNVYPPVTEEADKYKHLLQEAGFSRVSYRYTTVNNHSHFIMTAHKPRKFPLNMI